MMKPLTSCLAAGSIAALLAAPASAGAQSNGGQEPTQRGAVPDRFDRSWNPDCAGRRRTVKARFTVGADGYVKGPVDVGGLDVQSDENARRAVEAIHQAAPYASTYRGLTITANFDPEKACAQHH